MAHYDADGMECEKHPDILGGLTIDRTGHVVWHSHCDKGAFVAMLGNIVEQLRVELLMEAS